MNLFLDTQMYWYIGISIVAIVILVGIGILLSPKEFPIEIVKDSNGEVLFKVYAKGSYFCVNDFTKKYRNANVAINFRTYYDVETYISRRMNGWDEKTTD